MTTFVATVNIEVGDADVTPEQISELVEAAIANKIEELHKQPEALPNLEHVNNWPNWSVTLDPTEQI